MTSALRLAIVLATACVPLGAAANVDAELGRAVALKIGDVARFPGEGLQVTFAALVSDSRCPRGVQCIRAGEATIRILVEKMPEQTRTLELRSTAPRESVTYGPYSIRLTTVTPYPEAERSIQTDEYVVTIVVRR